MKIIIYRVADASSTIPSYAANFAGVVKFGSTMYSDLNKYCELADRIKADSDDMMNTYEAMSLAVDIITNDLRRESMFAIQEQNSLMRLIAKNNVNGQPGMQIEYGPGGVPKFL